MNIFELIKGKSAAIALESTIKGSPMSHPTLKQESAIERDSVAFAGIVEKHKTCSQVIDESDELACHELTLSSADFTLWD